MPKKTITIDEARAIREQFKPAFAGYVTDGTISDRDVLATIMDLSAHERIGIDCDTQKSPVVVNRVYRMGDFSGLLPFEQKFIEALFAGKKELAASQVSERIFSGDLHRVISDNTDALKSAAIKSSLLVSVDEKGDVTKLRSRGRNLKTAEGFRAYSPASHAAGIMLLAVIAAFIAFLLAVEIPMLSDAIAGEETSNAALGILPLVLSAAFVALSFIKKSFSIVFFSKYEVPRAFLLFALFAFAAEIAVAAATGGKLSRFELSASLWYLGALALLGLAILIRQRMARLSDLQKKAKGLHMLLEFKDAVPLTKKRYEELFEFISSAPLKRQRLYNEFMPHAIAFGLDTFWNKSFGIGNEIVVRSRAIGKINTREIGKKVDL